ncbi:MAG: maleylpyruvate isomerase family mycothiol-dependent enzyme [Actinomycetota bacterium]|nr:maleylpyruvate isomerase family mycothiol-dependent enzyme [Actinomycetota bacterium]
MRFHSVTLADAFAAKIAAVPDDRWASPSPCEGWTARDVVRHVIDSQEMLRAGAGSSPSSAATRKQSSRVESFGSTLLATLVLWKIRYG